MYTCIHVSSHFVFGFIIYRFDTIHINSPYDSDTNFGNHVCEMYVHERQSAI